MRGSIGVVSIVDKMREKRQVVRACDEAKETNKNSK